MNSLRKSYDSHVQSSNISSSATSGADLHGEQMEGRTGHGLGVTRSNLVKGNSNPSDFSSGDDNNVLALSSTQFNPSDEKIEELGKGSASLHRKYKHAVQSLDRDIQQKGSSLNREVEDTFPLKGQAFKGMLLSTWNDWERFVVTCAAVSSDDTCFVFNNRTFPSEQELLQHLSSAEGTNNDNSLRRLQELDDTLGLEGQEQQNNTDKMAAKMAEKEQENDTNTMTDIMADKETGRLADTNEDSFTNMRLDSRIVLKSIDAQAQPARRFAHGAQGGTIFARTKGDEFDVDGIGDDDYTFLPIDDPARLPQELKHLRKQLEVSLHVNSQLKYKIETYSVANNELRDENTALWQGNTRLKSQLELAEAKLSASAVRHGRIMRMRLRERKRHILP